jgi:SMODS-associating 4TM effector domain
LNGAYRPDITAPRQLIFISFRGGDAGSYAAVYLDEVLPREFGPDNVFRSSRVIPAGVHFPDVLNDALRRACVLLVVIGPGWATAAGPDGAPLLHQPADWVRREIAESLRAGIPVIPVLLTGATRPIREDLPPDIAALAERQTVYLRYRHAGLDTGHLVAQIRQLAPGLPAGGPLLTAQAPISDRQNAPEMIELLAAASTAHLRVQRFEAVRVSASLAMAALGMVACFVAAAATPIVIAGAVWGVVVATGFSPWARHFAKHAAVVQEMFDTSLFGLPWNIAAAGMPVPSYEIRSLARSFAMHPRQGRLRDWYVDTSAVPQPYQVFLCQQQNLAWDVRLRRRWTLFLVVALVSWLLLGIAIGFAAGLTVGLTAIRWYVPAIGAALFAVEGCRTQRDISAERARMLPLVQAEINRAHTCPLYPAENERLLRVAREVQDVIFTTRGCQTRVPDWFYARFRDTDSWAFQHDWAGTVALRPRRER